MNLTMAAFLQVSLALTGAEAQNAPQKGTYDYAHKQVSETGEPMFILVGAKWCPACVKMKRDVVPLIQRRGLFRKVAFAYVDLDKEKRLGRELTGRGPIPQMIMYRRTQKGWVQSKVIGGRSPDAVESFINQAVALDTKEKEEIRNASQTKQKSSPRQAKNTEAGKRST
jgi:thioredoxin-like negative regulator of GroEL